MHLTAHSMTIMGRRTNNEDALCQVDSIGLFAVADGLGGYEGGEVASALAVDAFERFVERTERDPSVTWRRREDMQKGFAENVLRAAAAEAHSAIVSHRTGRLGQMASTVASVWFQGRQASIAHVGDSRVYRMRKGILSLLTRDHSFYAELLMLGRDLPPRNEFPYKNQITRALGIDANPTADTATVDLEKGDRFLLCTDGLYDPFDDDTLANLMSSGSARDCCELLVEAAYLHGSLDNITAIVIDVT